MEDRSKKATKISLRKKEPSEIERRRRRYIQAYTIEVKCSTMFPIIFLVTILKEF